MNKLLLPRCIGGAICAIASKSQAHRLLICAALGDRPTEILCAETSADIEATAQCLSALGAKISYKNGVFTVNPIEKVEKNALLPCAESGSTLRFLLPVAAALGANATFLMEGRLPQRPLSPLWEELEGHGCKLSRPTENSLLCEGQLQGGKFQLAGNISSQFLSGLLFALPLLKEEASIMLTTPLQSASYVDMTRKALAAFGINIPAWHVFPASYCSRARYEVEGDWSNAAFWLTAGAICQKVTVTGLDPNSPQGDRKIWKLLKDFGGNVSWLQGELSISPGPLKACDVDARDIPDLVPPLALLAACAEGTTRIFGAERLKIKESDRLKTVAQCLNALGGKVDITEDGLLVTGTALMGGAIDSHNDHRIAMLGAIASCVCKKPVEIFGAEAVNKSYPKFWEDLEKMQRRSKA